MGWNGLDLQSDLSAALGDTSTSFKSKTLGWMNDIQDDMCSRFDWPFLRKTGSKLVSTSSEYQNLNISAPGAPTVASQNGGTLTTGSSYRVRVTFYQSSDDYETEGGTVSSSVTVNTPNLELALSSVPVSSEPLVTARRVYLSKDSGAFYLATTISDNTTTTATISADVSSTQQPPETHSIKMLLGEPWIESASRTLQKMSEAQMRLLNPAAFTSGTPEIFDVIDYNRIVIWPKASSQLTMKFNYIRIPPRIIAAVTNVPTIPIWLKTIFQDGVLWKGYEYRERALATTYRDRYEKSLSDAISDRSKLRHGAGRIRDVTGNTDGYSY